MESACPKRERKTELTGVMRLRAIVLLLTAAMGGCAGFAKVPEGQSYVAVRDKEFFVGAGMGSESHPSQRDAGYALQQVQLEQAGLTYVGSRKVKVERTSAAFNVFAGFRLNKSLEFETSLNGLRGDEHIDDELDVLNPTDPRARLGRHENTFKATTFIVAAIPRWEFAEGWALFARLGAGYSKTKFQGKLESSCPPNACGQDAFDRSENEVTIRDEAFSPVVGVGVDLANMIRAEYQVRRDLPIGHDSTDVEAWFVSIRLPFARNR